MAFVLVCAARSARGRPNAHNSMLVHVSRFKDVHQQVFGQLQDWLTNLKRVVRYGTEDDAVMRKMKALWIDDFERTSSRIRTCWISGAVFRRRHGRR